MPMVEVDELQLQQDRKLRSTVETWLKHPKAKRKILEAQKLVDPKADIPELDEPDPIEAATKPLVEQIAALNKKIDEDKEMRDRDGKIAEIKRVQDAGWKVLLGERRYTEAGKKAVEEIMEKKAILDPLDAAAIFERDHPPQSPVSPPSHGIGGWNFGEMPASTEDADNKYVEALLKAGKNDIPDGLLMSRIGDTIKDVRAPARR